MPLSFQTLLDDSELVGSVKMVRHRAPGFDVVERFFEDPEGFEAYHATQATPVYKGADYLAEFGALPGNRALFLGVWRVVGVKPGSEVARSALTRMCKIDDRFMLRDVPKVPPEVRIPNWVYSLESMDVLGEYGARLVIDWGAGARVWVQRILDKPILSLREQPKEATILKPFKGYAAARMSYRELKRLAADHYANREWRDALAVDGIYVIADRRTGSLYIGSAYGDGGIFGRWMKYAKNGHGGNKELKPLNPDFLQFSVLKPMPDATKHEVLDAESEWKRNLLSREFGLNGN